MAACILGEQEAFYRAASSTCPTASGDRGLPRASVVLVSQRGSFDGDRFMPEGTGQGNTCGCGRKVAMRAGPPRGYARG